MPLTICTFGPDGTPDDELDIGVSHHDLLQDEATRLGLVLLSRMHDYYEDAEYSPDDLGPLIDEAEVMRRRGNERIGPWLADLISLARRAMKRKVGLAAICD